MKARPSAKPQPPGGKWHAVSIAPCDTPCAAVLGLRGVRFLAAEAPRIPVAHCSTPATCRCIYRHHADRRAGLRRIADRGMHGRVVAAERRKSTDRRASD